MFRELLANRRLTALFIAAIALGACGAWLLSFTLASAGGEGEVVASVNGKNITREAFYARLEQTAGAQVLYQLITEQLILSQDVEVSPEEIEAERSRLRANYASDEEFEADLARYNLTPERLVQEIEMNLILQKLAAEGVEVTEQEIKDFFEKNKEQLGTPEQVKASHILVDSKEEAEKLLAQLKKGEDFAALAKEHSKDPGSAANGGALGTLTPDDQLVPEFKKAVFALKEGELSDPVKTEYGYHIIKVTAKTPARAANFDEMKDTVRDYLVKQKSRSLDAVIDDLYSAGKVQVHWDRYSSLANEPQSDDAQATAEATPAEPAKEGGK